MARLKTEMLIYLSPTKYELFLLRTTKDSPARLTLAGAREIDTHPSSKFSNKWVIFCEQCGAAKSGVVIGNGSSIRRSIPIYIGTFQKRGAALDQIATFVHGSAADHRRV